MDVDGYRHNFESFFLKLTYLMYINWERTTKGAHARLMKLTPFFLFVLVKRDKEEI